MRSSPFARAAHRRAAASGASSGTDGRRILILTAHTGAGHDTTAEALAEALRAAGPELGVRVRIYAPFAAGLAGRLLRIERWYDTIVAHMPHLWGLLYRITDEERAVRQGMRLAAALWGRRLRAVVRAQRPGLVVSVHPVCAGLVSRALPRGPQSPPHHCVVTDLVTVHCSWAAAGAAAYYVATPAAADALVGYGVAAARIHVAGLPLRRAFAAPPGAAPGGPIPSVLLLGGGRASRPLERAARALLAAPAPPRLTIVCGGNQRLRRRLRRAARGRATVLGWRDDVAALMRAADIVVTKAGSVTLAEAFSQARPVVVYHVLPGQEEGNIGLLRAAGLGEHVPHVSLLPAAVARAHGAGRGRSDATRAAWWGDAAGRVAGLIADAQAAYRAPLP